MVTTASPDTSPTPRRSTHRRRSAAVLTVALVLGAGLLAACGSDDGSTTAAGAVQPVAAEADTPAGHVLDITLDDYGYTTEQEQVAAGPVTLRVRNGGKEAHQVHIGKPKRPMTPDQFIALHHESEAAAARQVDWAGGVNGLEPGASQTAVSNLEPGDYLMVCYMPSPDGTSHVMKGMVGTVHVVASPDATGTEAPEATSTITVEDFMISLPKTFTGKGDVAVHNEGPQAHEVIFIRFKPGKTLADAAAWQAAGSKGPGPFTFAGGMGEVEPNDTQQMHLDLPPGDYAALCVLPDVLGDSEPHLAHGMVTPFTVR